MKAEMAENLLHAPRPEEFELEPVCRALLKIMRAHRPDRRGLVAGIPCENVTRKRFKSRPYEQVACDEHVKQCKHVASLKFTNDTAERMIYLVD